MEFLEAATNATSASLCLAVPSFFSGNIFYCYLGLARAVARRRRRRCNAFPPSPAPLPPPLLPMAARSFFLLHPLHPPRCAPCLRTPSLETLHYTTQHNSTLLTLLETLLYVSVSVPFSLLLFLSRARVAASFSLSLALPRTGGISTTVLSVRER